MFYAHFPQSLRCFVIWKFKANGALKLLELGKTKDASGKLQEITDQLDKYLLALSQKSFHNNVMCHLSRAYLDIKAVSLVGYLEDFGPGKSIYAQSVSVNEKAAAAHS